MGTFNDGDSGSSIRTKINTAIQKTEGTSAISTIDVDGGAIDGVTLGTNSAVTEAQVDNININGNTISSTNTNGDVIIDPNGTGNVKLGNFEFDADQTVGSGQDNYVLTYDHSSTSISLEAAASGGSLSGNMAGDIASNGHEIKFGDSGAADEDKLTFGVSDDLEIYHDGSNSYIKEGGTGDLRLQAANLAVQNTFGQYMIEANNGGAVNLYHNTALKVGTLSDGAAVRGQLKIQNSGGTTQYTLPASDGSANQVLQTDGSGAVSFATLSSGGADLYAANESSPTAQPSATGTNAIAIGDGAISSGTDSFANSDSRATGVNAVALGIANNGAFYGAQANYTVAIGQNASAAAAQSTALGHYSHAESTHAVAIGRARASGADSLAAAISTNSNLYGTGSAGNGIALGRNAKSSGARATAIGYESVSSGVDSHAFGRGATASSEGAFALGYKANANVTGCFAFASGIFGSVGDAQGRQYILRADTTDATATVLTTDNGNPSVFNCPRLDNDTVITFDGVVTATQNGAQSYAGWKVEGLIVSDGGTVSMAASTVTAIQNTPSWGLTLTADDSNNILRITVTGEAAHNIRWVANIRTVETTYA